MRIETWYGILILANVYYPIHAYIDLIGTVYLYWPMYIIAFMRIDLVLYTYIGQYIFPHSCI